MLHALYQSEWLYRDIVHRRFDNHRHLTAISRHLLGLCVSPIPPYPYIITQKVMAVTKHDNLSLLRLQNTSISYFWQILGGCGRDVYFLLWEYPCRDDLVMENFLFLKANISDYQRPNIHQIWVEGGVFQTEKTWTRRWKAWWDPQQHTTPEQNVLYDQKIVCTNKIVYTNRIV